MYFPPAHSTPLSHCPPRADILGNSHSTALVFSLFLPTSGVFMVYTLHLGISLFVPAPGVLVSAYGYVFCVCAGVLESESLGLSRLVSKR